MIALGERLDIKPKHFDRALTRLQTIVDEARRARVIRDVLVGLGVVALFAIMMGSFASCDVSYNADGEASHPGMIAIPAIILLAVFGWGGRWRLKRMVAKYEVCKELLTALRDDLMPGRRARLTIDLRCYTIPVKRFWTGRSPYGNPKAKFSDKWLRFEATLADGTQVSIRQQAAIKTKSKRIQKEKRRLFLSVRPNPRRYDLSQMNMHTLAKELKRAAAGLFHNRPEEFRVRTEQDDHDVKIRIVQTDAPILTSEITGLLRTVVAHMATVRRQGVYR